MNRKVILKKRPVGIPSKEDFENVTEPLSMHLETGELLVKVEWLSVDPAQVGNR